MSECCYPGNKSDKVSASLSLVSQHSELSYLEIYVLFVFDVQLQYWSSLFLPFSVGCRKEEGDGHYFYK